MGIAQYDPTPMTIEVANMIIEKMGSSFNYLKGRTLKINLANDKINVSKYNRDNNHPNLAQKAVPTCKNIDKESIQKKKTLHKKLPSKI